MTDKVSVKPMTCLEREDFLSRLVELTMQRVCSPLLVFRGEV